MNARRTSTEMSWGRGTAPFPRPHPQKQNAAVYTKVWTHLAIQLLDGLKPLPSSPDDIDEVPTSRSLDEKREAWMRLNRTFK
jgi:hypothetical protein